MVKGNFNCSCFIRFFLLRRQRAYCFVHNIKNKRPAFFGDSVPEGESKLMMRMMMAMKA